VRTPGAAGPWAGRSQSTPAWLGRSAVHSLKRDSIRHIGVSNFTAAQTRRVGAIAPVETLQPPYSLIARDVESEILPFAEREGTGVIVYSPVGSGLLTGKMTAERIEGLGKMTGASTQCASASRS
jgi:aryl-alcohol dehydrogenase-like predicted oxidoreductase